MRRLVDYAIVLLVVCSMASCAGENQTDKSGDIEGRARQFVEAMAKEDYAGVEAMLDNTMKSALPQARLQEVWGSVTGQLGAFKEQGKVTVEKTDGYDVAIVTALFEKGETGIKVVLDSSKQVSGLWFVPIDAETAGYKTPDYANPATFKETDVTVGAGKWALPGTLTVPNGDGPFPAVVLVHGSGPNDRDETIILNKPFKDLALGLASRGIAVLRYEKRTKAHPDPSMKESITIKEETTDDALAAVALLRKTAKIDKARIYVLGHSLGGMMAPRIAKSDPKLAGIIIMAGATQPMEDAIVDQFTHFAKIDGVVSKEEEEQLKKIRTEAAKVKNPKLSPSTPSSELPFGAPASYWLSLRGFKPAETAAKLKMPMLILQGGRDYQVMMKDYEGWTSRLSSRKDVTFKLYPKLNHLFIEGQGQSTPAEYSRPGHIAKYVIDDIAGWIAK